MSLAYAILILIASASSKGSTDMTFIPSFHRSHIQNMGVDEDTELCPYYVRQNGR